METKQTKFIQCEAIVDGPYATAWKHQCEKQAKHISPDGDHLCGIHKRQYEHNEWGGYKS